MGYELNAVSVTPPKQSGIYSLATVASSTAYKLPDHFKNNWITMQAEGLDIWIAFSLATLTVSKTAVSTVTSNLPAAAADGTVYLPAGTERAYDLARIHADVNETIWFGQISTGTTGFLRFWRSSGPAA